MDSPTLLRALKTTFGYDSFRPLQEEIIRDALAGRDVFALLPTGGGKSLCFQLPALLREGMTIVVSPLIALMKDQVDAITASGVAATFLNSTLGEVESRARLRGLHNGEYRLLYVAPERLLHPSFVERLATFSIDLVAIDEAHCISEWGHDFRPDYRRLGELVKNLGAPRIAAFTATATPEVRADIAAQLGLTDPRLHVRGFDRPNLTYSVVKAGGPDNKVEQMIELVRTRDGGVALVYAATRKNAEKYAADLKTAGMRARVDELQAMIAGLGDEALAAQSLSLKGNEAGVVMDGERDKLRRELTEQRDKASQRLSIAVAALENIRLDLLRLKAGVGTVDQLTADLNAARDLQAEIELAVDANREMEAVLRGNPASR